MSTAFNDLDLLKRLKFTLRNLFELFRDLDCHPLNIKTAVR